MKQEDNQSSSAPRFPIKVNIQTHGAGMTGNKHFVLPSNVRLAMMAPQYCQLLHYNYESYNFTMQNAHQVYSPGDRVPDMFIELITPSYYKNQNQTVNTGNREHAFVKINGRPLRLSNFPDKNYWIYNAKPKLIYSSNQKQVSVSFQVPLSVFIYKLHELYKKQAMDVQVAACRSVPSNPLIVSFYPGSVSHARPGFLELGTKKWNNSLRRLIRHNVTNPQERRKLQIRSFSTQAKTSKDASNAAVGYLINNMSRSGVTTIPNLSNYVKAKVSSLNAQLKQANIDINTLKRSKKRAVRYMQRIKNISAKFRRIQSQVNQLVPNERIVIRKPFAALATIQNISKDLQKLQKNIKQTKRANSV